MVSPVVTLAAGIRDYSRRPPPGIDPPPAGQSYIDPVFGSKIIRVTDSRHGDDCYHAYSYWPAFNYNSTRLLIACDDKPLLFKFDQSTEALTPDGTLWGDSGYKVKWEGAVWSQYVSNIIYALDQYGTRVWRIDVANRGIGGYTKLKDFSSKLGTSVFLDHLTVSERAGYYAFMTRSKSTWERKDVVLWDRYGDKTYVMPRNTDYELNEVKISKDGTQVMVNYDDETMVLWTPKTGKKVYFRPGNLTDNAGGHWDIGRDYILNSDQMKPGIAGRTFWDLKPPDNIVRYKRPDGKDNWSLNDHVSLRTENEEFFIASTYGGDGSWSAFEGEIYLGYTDGHGFVRLAHHRSKQNQSDWERRYRAQPRAVVDRQGKYVVFTSSLGMSSRMDVLILKIPAEYRPD